MAPIAWSDVVAAAPELVSTNPTTQADVVNYVNSILDVSMFDGESGFVTRLARISLAAHVAAMLKLGTGGPLISESDGKWSRGYAIPMSLRSEYMITSYGRTFWSLIGPQAHGPRLL
jgi:hypothetical protein